MHMKRRILTGIAALAGMILLIFDPATALAGARNGIDLCLATVLPSLFPFLIMTGMLTSLLAGLSATLLSSVGIFCGMPTGTESLLLIGLLGGYPAGAQAVSQSWRDGVLDEKHAQRLLGFCNHPGPAFLFGICGQLFPHPWTVWVLWGVLILSALLTARCIPRQAGAECDLRRKPATTLPKALESAVKTMGIICGWVILFRILIGYLEILPLATMPPAIRCLLLGLLELTNGCCMLSTISSLGLRFLLAALLLSFGGICVIMQTASVAGALGVGSYLKGKLLQTGFAFLLALPISAFMEGGSPGILLLFCLPIAVIAAFSSVICKNRSRNSVAVGV
jgi:hypothetical protein